jgi:dTDP-glucose 4,6-dehydratase
MRIFVTGGAGFIGSAVIRYLLRETDSSVVNIDKLTYAAQPAALKEVENDLRYAFERVDICNGKALTTLFERYRPDAVMHLAAESHVDRSIDTPADFVQTNIVGTYTLLEVARRYWERADPSVRSRFKFHHVSTDEVFGSLKDDELAFCETTPYRPNSPYSASKASSDHLVQAWHETFGLPVVISNCSNNYGPWQYPEKLIPLAITNGLLGHALPVYGNGENIRDWLFVEDHARALWAVLSQGRVGTSYVVGGRAERRNIDVVKTVCASLDDLVPNSPKAPHAQLIEFVEDRPGHDYRYAIDCSLVERELGWKRSVDFSTGIALTVAWYIQNRDWWEPIRLQHYKGTRLGLKTSTVP